MMLEIRRRRGAASRRCVGVAPRSGVRRADPGHRRPRRPRRPTSRRRAARARRAAGAASSYMIVPLVAARARAGVDDAALDPRGPPLRGVRPGVRRGARRSASRWRSTTRACYDAPSSRLSCWTPCSPSPPVGLALVDRDLRFVRVNEPSPPSATARRRSTSGARSPSCSRPSRARAGGRHRCYRRVLATGEAALDRRADPRGRRRAAPLELLVHAGDGPTDR